MQLLPIIYFFFQILQVIIKHSIVVAMGTLLKYLVCQARIGLCNPTGCCSKYFIDLFVHISVLPTYVLQHNWQGLFCDTLKFFTKLFVYSWQHRFRRKAIIQPEYHILCQFYSPGNLFHLGFFIYIPIPQLSLTSVKCLTPIKYVWGQRWDRDNTFFVFTAEICSPEQNMIHFSLQD